MLADDAIELVVINTPSITHYDYTKKPSRRQACVVKTFYRNGCRGRWTDRPWQQQQKMLTVFPEQAQRQRLSYCKKIIRSGLLGEIKKQRSIYDRFTPELSYKAHMVLPPRLLALYMIWVLICWMRRCSYSGLPNAVFADMMIMRENSLVDDYFEILLYYPSCRVRKNHHALVKEPQGFIIHGSNEVLSKTARRCAGSTVAAA